MPWAISDWQARMGGSVSSRSFPPPHLRGGGLTRALSCHSNEHSCLSLGKTLFHLFSGETETPRKLVVLGGHTGGRAYTGSCPGGVITTEGRKGPQGIWALFKCLAREAASRGWGDGSDFKMAQTLRSLTGCPFRGTGFTSQHPHDSSQLPETQVPDLTPMHIKLKNKR